MARTKNPNSDIDKFITEAQNIIDEAKQIDSLMKEEPIAFRRRLHARYVTLLGVKWETFLSDWFVSAINADPSQTQAYLDARIRDFAGDKLQLQDSMLASNLVTSSRFNVDRVARMVSGTAPADPLKNITFPSLSNLQKEATQWLAARYAAPINKWNTHDFSPILITRTARNALAHESDSAYDELKRAMAAKATHQDLRKDVRKPGKRTNHFGLLGVQTYLYEQQHGKTRLEILCEMLIVRANDLRV